MKQLFIFFLLTYVTTIIYGQCPSANVIYTQLLHIENNKALLSENKLEQAERLQSLFGKCNLRRDSVYARLLHKKAVFQYLANHQVPTGLCFENTMEAIRINRSGRKDVNPAFAVNSYFNIATYYKALGVFDKALAYADTAIMLAANFPSQARFMLSSRLLKGAVYKDNGDYQKSIEEGMITMKESRKLNDTKSLLALYNEAAQCHFYQGHLAASRASTDSAYKYAKITGDNFEISSALKIKALVHSEMNELDKAERLFLEAIALRHKTRVQSQLADDYLELGNFYLNKKQHLAKAEAAYKQVLAAAAKAGSDEKKGKALSVLGIVYYFKNDFKKALQYYADGIEVLVKARSNYELANPLLVRLSAVIDKDLVITSLNNKIECLLQLYYATNQKEYATAAVQTTVLADSFITRLRYQQINEQSKLYWRDRTRTIYSFGVEASYLTGNTDKLFFFMEKSKAVLLNDKLNELGASQALPAVEQVKEQALRTNFIAQRQKLSMLSTDSKEYDNQQVSFVQANEEYDRFIKSLEKKYPVYYQYKYADEVPALSQLQKYLGEHKQTFINFFISDTATYILTMNAAGSSVSKLNSKELSLQEISRFLQLCSEKDYLYSHYPEFAGLSKHLYQAIFKDTRVATNRVIVCPDNFILPFEALCTDRNGKNFLLKSFSFSYVYSARLLLKSLPAHKAQENFVGFAPVSYNPSLHLYNLTNAATALQQSASNYNSSRLLTHHDATRKNFLSSIGNCTVANIFSHASADSTEEPVFFMQDSSIKLSELQLLNNPATRLIVLSACQTNVGRNATGEGIYSLARGFSTAGIPSVASTLWKADEESIYLISEKFHEYLSKGMTKDEALQKAKLDYISKGHEKLLPYYWANLILMGNAEAIEFTSSPFYYWMGGGALLLTILLATFARKKGLFPKK